MDATSAGNAWAAGDVTDSAGQHTLILRWNGTAWARAASPSPGAGGGLEGVSARSPAGALAVGQYGAVGGDKAFALRSCPPPAG